MNTDRSWKKWSRSYGFKTCYNNSSCRRISHCACESLSGSGRISRCACEPLSGPGRISQCTCEPLSDPRRISHSCGGDSDEESLGRSVLESSLPLLTLCSSARRVVQVGVVSSSGFGSKSEVGSSCLPGSPSSRSPEWRTSLRTRLIGRSPFYVEEWSFDVPSQDLGDDVRRVPEVVEDHLEDLLEQVVRPQEVGGGLPFTQ